MKKWFIFDLDQTLLDDKHMVPPQSMKLIKEWKALGNEIGICTGKPLEPTRNAIPEIVEMSGFISAFNGAYIKKGDQINEYLTHFSDLSEFKRLAASTPFAITFGEGNDLYTDEIHQSVNDIITRNKPDIIRVIKDIDNIDCHVLRLIVHDPKDLPELTKKAAEFFKDFNVFSSTGLFVLITRKEVSKSNSLKALGKDLIYYFGDSGNDEDVFDMKDGNVITIAPANSEPGIKAKAKIVLSTDNNQGFFLEEILTKAAKLK